MYFLKLFLKILVFFFLTKGKSLNCWPFLYGSGKSLFSLTWDLGSLRHVAFPGVSWEILRVLSSSQAPARCGVAWILYFGAWVQILTTLYPFEGLDEQGCAQLFTPCSALNNVCCSYDYLLLYRQSFCCTSLHSLQHLVHAKILSSVKTVCLRPSSGPLSVRGSYSPARRNGGTLWF